MPDDIKQSRRKNLTFRPKGENPMHDEAVRIMDQIGRGMCDFVAASVVYYAMKLAEDKVDPGFTKCLNEYTARPKMLVVQSPMGNPPASKENTDVVAKRSGVESNPQKSAINILPYSDKMPTVKIEDANDETKPVASPLRANDLNTAGKSSLPSDLLDSLVMGFGGRKN